MRHIRQPNPWTCGPCALAMAIDRPLHNVILAAGHDGTVEGRPVGYTEADLTLAALRLGYATVRLPLAPVRGDGSPIPAWPEYQSLLANVAGPMVLLVRPPLHPLHAVAIEGRDATVYHDPHHDEPRPVAAIPPVQYVEFFLGVPPWRC